MGNASYCEPGLSVKAEWNYLSSLEHLIQDIDILLGIEVFLAVLHLSKVGFTPEERLAVQHFEDNHHRAKSLECTLHVKGSF